MGRELKRVALDFSWPLNKVWRGYINPHNTSIKCSGCDGTGYSLYARALYDQWYGHAPFNPRSTGSKPFGPNHPCILMLEKLLAEAIELQNQLCNSLAPILSADQLSDDNNKPKTDNGYTVPLASAIGSIAIKLEDHNNTTRNILRLIEL